MLSHASNKMPSEFQKLFVATLFCFRVLRIWGFDGKFIECTYRQFWFSIGSIEKMIVWNKGYAIINLRIQ